MMRQTDVIADIKTKIPFDALFKELFPEHYNPNGNSRCPCTSAHANSDDRPSFQMEKDHGFCHAGCKPPGKGKAWDDFSLWQFRYGCNFKSALKALSKRCGLNTQKGANDRIVETYAYDDESGTLLYEVCRTDRKDFPQRRPDPNRPDEWIWGLGDTRRVLYRLPDLSQAKVVWVPEGEKDVNNLSPLDLFGTTSPGGAGKWPGLAKKYRIHEPLKGKTVYILPDNDKPGREHAEDIARSLVGIASSVKILNLPGLPEKGDVSDFIEMHGPAEAKRLLLELAEAAESYKEPKGQETSPNCTPNLTDMGNAQRLANLYRKDIKFCPQLGWLIYDGRRWAVDDLAKLQGLAKETVREMYKEAARHPDEDTRKALASFALKCESAARIAAMTQLLPSEPGISVPHDSFDRDPMLFNTLNGTIDLRTGLLRSHSPDDLITKLAPVIYDPEAKCDRFEQFLLEIMNNDQELVAYLKRALGYGMTGETREQVWFFWWGKGENGKGTLMAVVVHVIGDYAVNTPAETFLETANSGIRNDLARLRGARIVTASEPKSKKFDPAVLKGFTGQDPITARFLHQEHFEFLPEGKLIFQANHRPTVRDTSHAFWRRVQLIPFNRIFTGKDKDDKLRERLLEEAPGILNWMVQGCLQWQKEGLNPPEVVQLAVNDYRSETDVLADFLEAHCITEYGQSVTVADLFERYQTYCDEKKIHKGLSAQRFNEDLLGRPGIVRERIGTTRVRTWLGIGLRSTADRSPVRSCSDCNLNGFPCPKGGDGRNASTCQYYERYN